MKQTARRHRILLTGASGPLGQALLPLLTGHDVIALDDGRGGPRLRGRSADGDIRTSVRGDVAGRWLGLPLATFGDLAAWSTVVIHLAAVPHVHDLGEVRADVDGARHVARFAEQADALLLHVGTAYVDGGGVMTDRPGRDLTSAFRAEGVVRAASCRSTIVRTSLVVDGPTPRPFPGRDREAASDRLDRRPSGAVSVPVEPRWLLDVVPEELVARALVALLDGRAAGRTVWLTAGDRAPTVAAVLALAARGSDAGGVPVVPLDLCRPVAFPTSVPEILGGEEERPGLSATDLRSLSRWADRSAVVALAS